MDEYDSLTRSGTPNSKNGGLLRSIIRFALLAVLLCATVVSIVALSLSVKVNDDVGNLKQKEGALVPPPAVEMDLSNFDNKTILYIAAHPDDVVGANGAFLSALTSRPNTNTSVHVLVMTNGNAGCSRNASVSPAECAILRAQEERDCDEMLGVQNVAQNVVVEEQFNDNKIWDGTYSDEELVAVIVRSVRRVKPQIIFTFYPDPIWSAIPSDGYGDMGFHPDHQKVGKLVASAVAGVSASNGVLYNATFGAPWRAEQLWFWQFVNPSVCFTVSPALFEVQKAAFLRHRTQYQNNPSQITDWVTQFSLLVGKNCGRPDGTLAEGFQRYW